MATGEINMSKCRKTIAGTTRIWGRSNAASFTDPTAPSRGPYVSGWKASPDYPSASIRRHCRTRPCGLAVL
jgi:hypothetical protein